MASDSEQLAIDLLRLHKSTWNVEEPGLLKIAAASEVQVVSSGTVLCKQDAPVTDLWLVINGRLAVTVTDEKGQDNPVQFLKRDDQAGLIFITEQHTSPFSVVAAEKSQLIRIARDDFIKVSAEVPLWKRQLYATIGSKAPGRLKEKEATHPTKIVALLHASPSSRPTAQFLLEQLKVLDQNVCLLTDDPSLYREPKYAVESLVDERHMMLPLEQVRSVVAKHIRQDHVFLDVSFENAMVHPEALVDRCDRVYWFVDPASATVAEQMLQDVSDDADRFSDKHRWVWMLDRDMPVLPSDVARPAALKRDLKIPFPGTSGDSAFARRQAQFRLLHDFRNVRLGIALGGGAAKGMAHLGVLQVLDETGIVLDAISGTSVGAMVGCLYAAGMRPRSAIENFEHDLTPTPLERKLPGGDQFYMLRKYRTFAWEGMLRKHVQDWKLEQLPVPMSTVTVDLIGVEQVVRDQGDVAQAILESINLPGLAPPICRDGKAYVDGGVLNVLPADVLVNRGTDYVIGVNVSAHLGADFGGNTSETPTSEMKEPGVFETISRVMAVVQQAMREKGSNPADFMLAPDVTAVDPADFQHAGRSARIGEEAMKQEIQSLISQLESVDPCLTLSCTK